MSTKNSCPPLQPPINGAITSLSCGSSFGSQVSISCNQGYRQRGSTIRSCEADGTWSDNTTTCNSKDKNEQKLLAELTKKTKSSADFKENQYKDLIEYGLFQRDPDVKVEKAIPLYPIKIAKHCYWSEVRNCLITWICHKMAGNLTISYPISTIFISIKHNEREGHHKLSLSLWSVSAHSKARPHNTCNSVPYYF